MWSNDTLTRGPKRMGLRAVVSVVALTTYVCDDLMIYIYM